MQIYSSITSFQQDNNGSIFKQDVSSENNKVHKKYGIYNKKNALNNTTTNKFYKGYITPKNKHIKLGRNSNKNDWNIYENFNDKSKTYNTPYIVHSKYANPDFMNLTIPYFSTLDKPKKEINVIIKNLKNKSKSRHKNRHKSKKIKSKSRNKNKSKKVKSRKIKSRKIKSKSRNKNKIKKVKSRKIKSIKNKIKMLKEKLKKY